MGTKEIGQETGIFVSVKLGGKKEIRQGREASHRERHGSVSFKPTW